MSRRAYRSAGFVRSLGLLWVFVTASAAILAAGAIVLSSALTQSFRDQILADYGRQVGVYTHSVLEPTLVRRGRVRASRNARRKLARAIRATEFTSIAVWSRRGKLVVAAPRGRGAMTARRKTAAVLRSRGPSAEIADVPAGRGGSQEVRSIVVWAPIRSPEGRAIGAARILLHPFVLDASIATVNKRMLVVVVAVFATLWLALFLLVRSTASRLKRQNDALDERSREITDTTRKVEESLLETIETLNAAVEARDPYTAGHSQRVRRVALAIGRELSLSAHELGALGTAALFHDVGKIGIPDSILTKAGPLEPAEAAIMREHVTRGAEIASKVTSFHDAIPAIRHHHERWDGLGYPDGLRGDEIPLGAAIVGLADAWDAMTTDRPYAHGLSLNEAMLQIRSGRGKQFNPIVVDAFWNVAKRRPSDVLPPEVPATVVAV